MKSSISQHKFETFLKNHRPQAPAAPANEAQSIWASIYSAEGKKRHSLRAHIFSAALLGLILVSTFLALRSVEHTYLSEGDVAMLTEAMELEFMENEEINEFSELATLVR